MLDVRYAPTLWTIPVLITVCLVCLPTRAEDTGGGDPNLAPQASRYVFLAGQSTLVQTGGIAGVHWTYAVEGQFQLTVDFQAGTAAFAQVDANAIDDSPYERSVDPNEVFAMTSLLGTALSDTTLQFTGQAADGSDVRITATLQADGVHLVAETVPPPNSADFFLFNMDALAQRKYAGGTGEPNDPYQIATAADLIALGETPADYDKHFILTADIDLDPNLPGRRVFDRAVIAPDIDPNDEWSDFQGTPFTGAFDGNGHTVSNPTITGGSYLGLFGQLGLGAIVSNLGLHAVKVSGVGHAVGGLVGGSYSAIITASYSGGSVSGTYDVGGLVGRNHGGINISCSTGAVTGHHCVGGLVGDNTQDGRTFGYIRDSYSIASVTGGAEYIGGLVGWNLGELVECYSTGAVIGDEYVGGLIGSDYSREVGWGTVTACFWDTQTSGQMLSSGGDGKTTAQMQDPNTFIAAGWDFAPNDIWFEPEGGGYPILWWQLSALPSLPQFSGGTGEPNDPYLISTPEELNSIGHNRRLMECHFKLVDDIDLAGLHFYPIGNRDCPYRGVFDGDGYAISNLTIDGEERLGLFGYLGSGSEARDLGVVDVNITGSGDYIGGLAGCNSGTMTKCYSTGTVSGDTEVGGLVGLNWGVVADCHSTGTVSGNGYVGGLVGGNSGHNGIVTNCCSTGAVSGERHVGGLVGGNSGKVSCSYSTGAVSGRSQVGGLVGWNSHLVSQCYSNGHVSGRSSDVGGLVGGNAGEVSHCYSSSTISGNLYYVGWLVGSGDPEKVTSSFWEIKKWGQVKSAGGTGKTTTEMQMASTFLDVGWDFVDETDNGTEDIWWIDEGQDYPRLWWEGGAVLVLDDFESYTDEEPNRVFDAWIGGYADMRNGVLVGHVETPYAEQEIVHSGNQSMPLLYETWDTSIAEAMREWRSPQDWTIEGVDTLTLYFRGEADNDVEPLCVGVEDRAGQVAVLPHPDADAVLATEWQTWHIPLADLQAEGVDLASVARMIIGLGEPEAPQPGGSGRIYIDDIRLTKRMP